MNGDAVIGRVVEFDRSLSARLAMRRAGGLHFAAQIVSHSGDGVLWIAIGAVLLLIDQPALALRVEVAVLAMIAIVAALKFAFRRRRPSGPRDQLYFEWDVHSFPSGHATRTAALTIVLGALSLPLFAGMCAWAALVSLSRVALKIHYVSDVVMGTVVGVISGLMILAMV